MSELRIKDLIQWLRHLQNLPRFMEQLETEFFKINKTLNRIEARIMALDFSQVAAAFADFSASVAAEKAEVTTLIDGLNKTIADMQTAIDAGTGTSAADQAALNDLIAQVKTQTDAVKAIATTPTAVTPATEEVATEIGNDPALPVSPDEVDMAVTDTPEPGTTPPIEPSLLA